MALISVADALNRVLAHAEPLPPEEVPLDEANGRVLACDLTALRTQPPADVSAMDGYAVRTADVVDAPVCLKVIGEVAAGRPFGAPIGPGEAARIFTGGVIPAGADTVVVQESANREADRVGILTTFTGMTWTAERRVLPSNNAPMHRSVYERFDLPKAFEYDVWEPYRPETLSNHVDFAEYYEIGASFPATSLTGATAVA